MSDSLTKSPQEFINDVLIREMNTLKTNHPYLAFNLICSGIEFLGKCLSDDEWNEVNPQKYFLAGLSIFPKGYQNIQKELWDLRNSLIHAYLPHTKVGLSELRHDKDGEVSKENHPYKQNGQYKLIVEHFYSDFAESCRIVMRERGKSKKFKKGFIQIPK